MNERKTHLHPFFSTPVWTYKLEKYQEINDNILEYINELKKDDPNGLIKSNVKGWHSKEFDLKNPSPILFVNSIMPSINEVINDMNWDTKKQKIQILNMWSIINYKDSSNERHIHGNSFISAAYYIKAPKNSGNIVFYDPRSAPTYSHPISTQSNNLNATSHSIEPQEGLLVMFPSYLQHSVETNKSDEERVVVSFNINISKN